MELQAWRKNPARCGRERDTLGPRVDRRGRNSRRARQKRSEAEVALARAESDYAHHAQQCRDELNTDADHSPGGIRARIGSGRAKPCKLRKRSCAN